MTDALAFQNNDISFRITMYICIAKYVFVRTDIDALPKND
jgi:hypothetical protein